MMTEMSLKASHSAELYTSSPAHNTPLSLNYILMLLLFSFRPSADHIISANYFLSLTLTFAYYPRIRFRCVLFLSPVRMSSVFSRAFPGNSGVSQVSGYSCHISGWLQMRFFLFPKTLFPFKDKPALFFLLKK